MKISIGRVVCILDETESRGLKTRKDVKKALRRGNIIKAVIEEGETRFGTNKLVAITWRYIVTE